VMVLVNFQSHETNRVLVPVGLSTVPYTATAVLLTISIRPRAVPYVSRILEFESHRRYRTVITTAGIRVKTAVRGKVAWKKTRKSPNAVKLVSRRSHEHLK
jgi:hypothetical protein